METTFLSGNHVLWYIKVMTVALQGNSQTYKGKPEYWLACYCTMNDAAWYCLKAELPENIISEITKSPIENFFLKNKINQELIKELVNVSFQNG